MASRSLASTLKQPVPVGVVGLGLMGTSIVTCLVAAGHRVVAIDKDAARRRNLKRRVSVVIRPRLMTFALPTRSKIKKLNFSLWQNETVFGI